MGFSHFSYVLLIVVAYRLLAHSIVAGSSVEIYPSSITVEVDKPESINVSAHGQLGGQTLMWFTYEVGNLKTAPVQPKGDVIIKPLPNVTLSPLVTSVMVNVTGIKVASMVIGLNSSNAEIEHLNDVFVRITVVHCKALAIVNSVIGWLYFLAWSVSFYPQIFSNWHRKSVIGLNFDFLAYNLTGFLAYGLFNVGMYWIDDVKREYKLQDPHGVNPVQLNDVVFTLHAIAVTAFTIFQCFIYERGDQRISRVCIGLQIIIWIFSLTTLFIAISGTITWLRYLYYFAYIKLAISLIKYIPQALMNFRRRSTSGWSIGNVLLDFTGGSLSILQMFLISYNNDDWSSIFGDPTKFGLGLLSVLFDVLFMVQHYVLYRPRKPHYEPLDTEDHHEA